MVDTSGKIVSWVPVLHTAYAEVCRLAWYYLLNTVPQSNGKPAYYTHSYINPDTQALVGWPHNPAGLYAMLVESAIRYYQYSGDALVLTAAQAVIDHQLQFGMTAPTDNWSNVPYASGDVGSLIYDGAAYGNTSGAGDGKGVIQPDKVAEFAQALVMLYKLTGTQGYLDNAVNCANQLVSHIRTGNTTQSPWPYRVVALSGVIKEQYCAHVDSALELFDELIALGVGSVSSYQTARTTLWNWTISYPLQNGNWSAYFEDVDFMTNPSSNLNQLNAMMFARYLLNNPDKDPSWESHVRALITWTEQNFADTPYYGSTPIKEQFVFHYTMGSHTSRYASINALLYEKTGDLAAKEKAYRAFNWSTYMCRSNGVVIDGPQVNNQWFTDGYGDYVRHFMVGIGAVPAFAPNGQTHILYSSSLVQSVTYTPTTVSYQTFDSSGTEKVKVDRVPSTITLGGSALTQRGDLVAEGWMYDSSTSVVSIRRDGGANVVITLSGTPVNQPPTVNLTAPANNTSYIEPASFVLTAAASDSEGSLDKVEFYQDSALLSTDTSPPFSHSVSNLGAGSYFFYAKAYDTAGSSTTSAQVTITVGGQAAGWNSNDVGPVGVAGSGSFTNGIFTVRGSGIDIWDTTDSFQFYNTTMTGDGEIIARIVSQDNTSVWAMAGVMMRENLTAGSRHVVAATTPSNGISLSYRTATSGSTTYASGGTGTAPEWVRIVRTGNAFVAYRSSNGSSWTNIGTVTMSMASTINVGLIVLSQVNSTLGTGVFDNVFVTSSSDLIPPVISGVTAGSINQNGGSISWTTNEVANSQIEYGQTTSYGSQTAINSSLVTSHSQVVSGLLSGTLYHYRVRSADAAGNQSISGDFTFTTT